MEHRSEKLSIALIPVGILIVGLYLGIQVFDIWPHIPLIVAAFAAGALSLLRKGKWVDIEASLVRSISVALPSIMILMAIGMLIGTWTASGIVPYLIKIGLDLLSPNFFLPAACLICIVVSISTGSSWSTAGTVGVALIGVGQGLGFSLPMVAGAIVSGAYFGDKMSPLSETTNLASAVAGAKLFDHIRHLTVTSVPSIVIALAVYTFLGWGTDVPDAKGAGMGDLSSVLAETFTLSPILLLAPVAVIGLVALRVPALPAVLIGAGMGGVLGIWIQGASWGSVLAAAQTGYVSETGIEQVDELLSRGGLESMFWTISLIVCSMAFGGTMEAGGMLRAIAESLLRLAKTGGQLMAATVATCIGMNVIAPDQYLSIIIPGRMYREAYERLGLAPRALSRCLEDGGTITSPLIPWNSCGVFMMSALTVNPFAYLPFAFFNIINPILSVIFSLAGIAISKTESEESLDAPDGKA